MSDTLAVCIGILIVGGLMLFFFGAAKAAGKPVPRRHTDEEGPYVGPWGILDSPRRDPDLEWDEIAIMNDEHHLDDEDG